MSLFGVLSLILIVLNIAGLTHVGVGWIILLWVVLIVDVVQ